MPQIGLGEPVGDQRSVEASSGEDGEADEVEEQVPPAVLQTEMKGKPPGHHSQHSVANGFCVFNNVAVAAHYAKRNYNLTRVLIVDWDVHHGQGIQYSFEDDPSVLYLNPQWRVQVRNGLAVVPDLPIAAACAAGHAINSETDSKILLVQICSTEPAERQSKYHVPVCLKKESETRGGLLQVLFTLVLPVAYGFGPGLVVTALGGGTGGDWAAQAQLTSLLQGLAEGRVLALIQVRGRDTHWLPLCMSYTVCMLISISLVQVSVSVELHLVKINNTWSEAQSYCREHYTDLVSIRSTQEVEKINTTVQDVQTERVWIGLFRNNTSQQWQWSNGDYFMYLNWENNAAYTDLYAVVVGKQWLGRPSSYSLYFICQKVAERDSSALKGYYLVTEFKSWTDAQQHCRNEGSELASIRNQEEQEALNTVNTETSRFVWIGFYRESNSQPWKWSNGDPIEKWDSGEPDLSNAQDVCVSMNGNAPGRAPGFWNDRSCTERFYFLCSGGK
ncbi:UNVERIFIED_CONTAM: hypothetical protein FKN15_047664 [Acipenser sinensis]